MYCRSVIAVANNLICVEPDGEWHFLFYTTIIKWNMDYTGTYTFPQNQLSIILRKI